MSLIDIKIDNVDDNFTFRFINTTAISAFTSFENAVDKINWKAVTNFTFDFTDVTFIGSPIVGTILNILNKAKEHRFNIHFRGMSPTLIELLKTAGAYELAQLSHS